MSNETRGLHLLYTYFRGLHRCFASAQWVPEKSGRAIDRGLVLLLYLNKPKRGLSMDLNPDIKEIFSDSRLQCRLESGVKTC